MPALRVRLIRMPLTRDLESLQCLPVGLCQALRRFSRAKKILSFCHGAHPLSYAQIHDTVACLVARNLLWRDPVAGNGFSTRVGNGSTR